MDRKNKEKKERTLDLSGTGRFVRIAWPERNGGTLTLIETDVWVKKH